MPLMTNAEAFRYDFGIYATELWAMTEAQFLEWLNADCDRERPNAVPVVRSKHGRGDKMTKEMAIKILRGDVLGTNEQTHEAVFMAIRALKEQAQVNAVPVVYCKNCKHYKEFEGEMECWARPMMFPREPNDFCSMGERKEDANESKCI